MELALPLDLDEAGRLEFLDVVRERRRCHAELAPSFGTGDALLRAGDLGKDGITPRVGDRLGDPAKLARIHAAHYTANGDQSRIRIARRYTPEMATSLSGPAPS
jgi:hypothetical protein